MDIILIATTRYRWDPRISQLIIITFMHYRWVNRASGRGHALTHNEKAAYRQWVQLRVITRDGEQTHYYIIGIRWCAPRACRGNSNRNDRLGFNTRDCPKRARDTHKGAVTCLNETYIPSYTSSLCIFFADVHDPGAFDCRRKTLAMTGPGSARSDSREGSLLPTE